jgi:uncharacterized protein (DUF2249 family)
MIMTSQQFETLKCLCLAITSNTTTTAKLRTIGNFEKQAAVVTLIDKLKHGSAYCVANDNCDDTIRELSSFLKSRIN